MVKAPFPLFSRHFSITGQNPLDHVLWSLRTATIKDEHGTVIFKQDQVVAPSFWSDAAVDIVASKYFHGILNQPERESSVREMIERVVTTLADWAANRNYFATEDLETAFRSELAFLALHQYAAFNSPVWFNVGVHPNPQCSACFILGVQDSMDSLLELQRLEAMLFKFGSGTGSNLSQLRSKKEYLQGGGRPAGPVSFMRGFDAWAQIVKSGGKTRRAAKMQILDVDHPDILEFIHCKQIEEDKAKILAAAGYRTTFSDEGGAYDGVWFQNSNLSVRVSDEFMELVKNRGTFRTIGRTNRQPIEELSAEFVFRSIAAAAHNCGDPGLQFDTRINEWNTCKNSGRINASNPCGEYLHLDNTACNLASVNLLKFLRPDLTFDADSYLSAIKTLTIALDLIAGNSSYPTKEIANRVQSFRQIGIGYANLGALLMTLGVAYDSATGRQIAATLTALLSAQSYRTSAALAELLGPFPEFSTNREVMLDVVGKHVSHAERLECSRFPELALLARALWREALEQGERHGFRNAQVTAIAPTGTIAFMMGCDTTGIEPDLALIKVKTLVGGGSIHVENQSLGTALRSLGYSSAESDAITAYVRQRGFIEGAPGLSSGHLPIFDCALPQGPSQRSINWRGHIDMLAAVQPFVSGGISKTVNIQESATVDDIVEIYFYAWAAGLKSITVYRDGSKYSQPLKIREQNGTYSVAVCDESGCS